ncbi:hypothetical protein PMPD1_2498 [Paramixta manurensis]|uniref:Uncharacterized protein n=1 Tax=Paramixta manurensis TaxID=2740817 RepID=A0A6M8UI69_9GAMM|nr:hypothetical protein PMPD1_2498 [Erwiniaceae bacterium PD-1]
MSYIEDNIHLLSAFNRHDSKTVATMKEYVLPWAKERLKNLEDLNELCPPAVFLNDINELRQGIKTCEERLQAL